MLPADQDRLLAVRPDTKYRRLYRTSRRGSGIKSGISMSAIYKNLSDFSATSIPSAEGMKFGIVVSEWNGEITGKLLEGCLQTLLEHGAAREKIDRIDVPGSFELPA